MNAVAEIRLLSKYVSMNLFTQFRAIAPLSKDMMMHRMASIAQLREDRKSKWTHIISTIQYHIIQYKESNMLLLELTAFFKAVNIYYFDSNNVIFYYNFICFMENNLHEDTTLSECIISLIADSKKSVDLSGIISIDNIVSSFMQGKSIGIRRIYNVISFMALLLSVGFHFEFKYYDFDYIRVAIKKAQTSKNRILESIKSLIDKKSIDGAALKYIYYLHSKAQSVQKYQVHYREYFTKYELSVIDYICGENTGYDKVCRTLEFVYEKSDVLNYQLFFTRREVIEALYIDAMKHYNKIEDSARVELESIYSLPLYYGNVLNCLSRILNIKSEQLDEIKCGSIHLLLVKHLHERLPFSTAFKALYDLMWKLRLII